MGGCEKNETKPQGAGSLPLTFSEEITACSQPVTRSHLKVFCKRVNEKKEDI